LTANEKKVKKNNCERTQNGKTKKKTYKGVQGRTLQQPVTWAANPTHEEKGRKRNSNHDYRLGQGESPWEPAFIEKKEKLRPKAERKKAKRLGQKEKRRSNGLKEGRTVRPIPPEEGRGDTSRDGGVGTKNKLSRMPPG